MDNIRNIVKKGLLVGLGTADATRVKVNKVLGEFVKRKIITRQDGRVIAAKLIKELDKQRTRLAKLSNQRAKALAARFNALEKQLESRGRKVAKSLINRVQKELK